MKYFYVLKEQNRKVQKSVYVKNDMSFWERERDEGTETKQKKMGGKRRGEKDEERTLQNMN